MALAPCLLGYGAAAQRLYSNAESLREGNPYFKWIENYVAEDYVEAVRKGSGALRTWHGFGSGYEIELMHGSSDRIKHLQAVSCQNRGAGEDLRASNRDGGTVLGLWRTFMITEKFRACISRPWITLKQIRPSRGNKILLVEYCWQDTMNYLWSQSLLTARESLELQVALVQ